MPTSFPPRRVIVVGAGVAGLSCAAELRRSPVPVEVVVLEARSRPGGRILTHWLTPPDPSAPPLPVSQPQPQQPHHQSQAPWPRLNTDRNNSSSNSSHPHNPIRHDFRALATGANHPNRVTDDGNPRISVDLGASIMHGCGDKNQLVFKRAINQRIRAPIVAGAGFYESTEHSVWYDDSTATTIATAKIVELHNLFFMASRYMAAVAAHSDDGAANMQTIFNCGVSYVCENLDNRQLEPFEQAILKKICARSVGYCSPMAVMALMQASAGMETTSVDAHIGVPHEEDDPPFPGEIPSMSPTGIRSQAARLHKSVMATQRPPKNMIASKKGGPGDRIVLDGYTPFLIDRLKEGTEIRYNQSVCGVSKGVKPVDPAVDLAAAEQALGAGQKRTPSEEAQIAWNSDPETATRTVYVATRGGEMHQGDFVVITIPLGVLQREHDESSVTFSPPLSEEKLEAIRGMGMGVHNKIVLRFREDDVFWPPKIPQLNCLDPRFQFFNLHSYGKPGVLLVHVFAESGFANGYWGLSDEGTVAEVLMVLGGMFCPPIEASNEGATSGSNTQSPSAAKPALARRRIAKMLNICDNCRRPLDSSDPDITTTEKSAESTKCKACGSVMVREDEGEEHFQKLTIDPMQANQQPAKDASNAEAKADAEEELILAPKRVTWQTFPAPEEYIVTRWEEDPFALGSYSYMPCGSTWTMIDQIAAPEPRDSAHPYLFFAGEHCSDMGWQCVHGAYETGIRAAREIMTCLNGGVLPDILEEPPKDAPKPPSPPRSAPQPSLGTDPFWTAERERALTRALIGYSDVYGNINDVIDEIAHALETFKKEPTDLPRGEIRSLVQRRIQERAEEEDIEAKAFLRFHNSESSSQEESFPKPFHEINDRDRLIGLNGSKLRELYAADIIRELKDFAKPVAENQVSYREALRKIAVMIYKKDGGLMTKRCLSEYLRTQEFGTGPQKELYLAKYLPQK